MEEPSLPSSLQRGAPAESVSDEEGHPLSSVSHCLHLPELGTPPLSFKVLRRCLPFSRDRLKTPSARPRCTG